MISLFSFGGQPFLRHCPIDMSSDPDNSVTEAIGSRSWLEDNPNTTAEAEQKHWEEVKKGSDELLSYYWANYGKWGTH